MPSPIRPIKNDADYKAVVARVDVLMDARPGTPEADELEVLATLVDKYESERFPIEAPDPVDALVFRMEQAGLSRRDLEPMIGTRARVSEVLSGKRSLTLAMIRELHSRLLIPAESLIGRAPSAVRTGHSVKRRTASRPRLSA